MTTPPARANDRIPLLLISESPGLTRLERAAFAATRIVQFVADIAASPELVTLLNRQYPNIAASFR